MTFGKRSLSVLCLCASALATTALFAQGRLGTDMKEAPGAPPRKGDWGVTPFVEVINDDFANERNLVLVPCLENKESRIYIFSGAQGSSMEVADLDGDTCFQWPKGGALTFGVEGILGETVYDKFFEVNANGEHIGTLVLQCGGSLDKQPKAKLLFPVKSPAMQRLDKTTADQPKSMDLEQR